jgi:hypothetical protein
VIWWPSKEVFVSYRRGDFVGTLDEMEGNILVRFKLFEERCELNFEFLLVVSSRRPDVSLASPQCCHMLLVDTKTS